MNYTITKADLASNKNDIKNIWEKNYPGIIEKKYEWIYKNNPSGSTQVWLLKHEDSGEYVGVTALFPRRFIINGRQFIGGIAGDLLVDHNHRSMGPALLLQRSVLSAIDDETVDFLYGFPNKAAEPIIKRVGFKVLGGSVRLVKTCKTASMLYKFPLGKYWGIILGPVFDFVLRLFFDKTCRPSSKNYTSSELRDFDDRFDQLWNEVNSTYIITGERTSEYLRWRFINVPYGMNKIFALFDAKKKYVVGYIIYRHREKHIEIVDFTFPMNEKGFVALMADFFRYTRSSKYESLAITLLQNSIIEKRMKNFGFFARKNNQKIYAFLPEKLLAQYSFLKDMDSWILLQSDDDDI